MRAGQASRRRAGELRRPAARRAARAAGTAHGLAARAYAQVRDAILEGEHLPGEVLFETHLAGRLGMSRTPVREALQLLAREGFVEIIRNRGYLVSRLSIEDVRELFELRECLEGLATRSAALRVSDRQIAELQDIYQRYARAQRWDAWLRIGTEFHDRILALAGNARLAGILGALNAQIGLTRLTQLRDVRGRRAEALVEHRAILDAICARDAEGAERYARAHVRRSSEATLRAFSAGHGS